jgi:hypothetical protein
VKCPSSESLLRLKSVPMLYVVVVVAAAVVAAVGFPISVSGMKSREYSHSHSHLVSVLDILETPTSVTTDEDHYSLPPLLLLLLLWKKDLLLRVPMRAPISLLDRSDGRNETCY